MLVSALTLALAGLTAASPVATDSHYPAKSHSKGFRLIIDVVDHAHDFKPSIQNSFINSIHVGAGLALVGVGSKNDNPRVFYQNGTIDEYNHGQSTIISDGGTPPSPEGLSLVNDPGSKAVSTAHLDAGAGTKGVAISKHSAPYAIVLPETFAICNESLQYYQGAHFLILKHAAVTVGYGGKQRHNVPQGCAPVRLIPECTKLNNLPKGAFSNHQFALESDCYNDVSAIKW